MVNIRPMFLAPPLIFLGFVAAAASFMFRDDREALPSVFINAPAPALPDATLPGYAALSVEDLTSGQVSVVNFWASWCPPCRAEHPYLLALKDRGVRVFGVNFKDKASQATSYIENEGNPFLGIAFDPKGRSAIDWGVTAPPETFIIAGDGTVLFKFIGPLVGSDLEQRFEPALQKALAQQPAN